MLKCIDGSEFLVYFVFRLVGSCFAVFLLFRLFYFEGSLVSHVMCQVTFPPVIPSCHFSSTPRSRVNEVSSIVS